MAGASERAERLVVGAGVIGLAVALELRRRGCEVVLLERDEPGAGATGAAGGMLAPVFEAEHDPPALVELGLDSLGRYREFVAGLEALSGEPCRYRREGTLRVALTRDDRAELDHLRRTLEGKGLAVRELGGEELREREPHLSHRVTGGLFVPGDHQVDPRALARSLAAAFVASGGTLVRGARVDAIDAEAGRVRGVRGRDAGGAELRVETSCVVVAAGAWAARDLGMHLPRTGLRPVKGQLVRLRGTPLIDHVVRTPEVYLVPRADGELLVGATMEEMGFDMAPTGGAVMDLLGHAWEALPGVYDLELAEISVGLRSAVDDQLPLIGPAGPDGLYLALGHFRNGILLAPATAHYLASWIVDGARPDALAPFDPARIVAAAGVGESGGARR